MPWVGRDARVKPALRWRATGAVASTSPRSDGSVRGLSASANAGGRDGARGTVLGSGGPIRGGSDRFSCVGGARIDQDGIDVELGDGHDELSQKSATDSLVPPPPPPPSQPPPKSSGGAGRRNEGPPRGRPPAGMTWCTALQDWKPDPTSKNVRHRPYVSARNRSAPGPRGRPPAGTQWCSKSRAYVMKVPLMADVGKTRFKIVVPPQLKKTSWSIPEAEPEQSP